MFHCSYGLSLEEESDYGSLMCKTKGTSVGKLGSIFFNTWFTDFFSQNIKVGGGKKIKIKYY